jgi:hypothetical protein
LKRVALRKQGLRKSLMTTNHRLITGSY